MKNFLASQEFLLFRGWYLRGGTLQYNVSSSITAAEECKPLYHAKLGFPSVYSKIRIKKWTDVKIMNNCATMLWNPEINEKQPEMDN